jgi:hypothetical protein
MEKTMLVELKGHDQIERFMSGLQETVESGTSVIFSFPLPGRVMVLRATSQEREEMNETSRIRENRTAPHAGISPCTVPNANVKIQISQRLPGARRN